MTCYLLTVKETLALKQQNDLVHNAPNTLLRHIDDQIGVLGHLVRVVDSGESLDLTPAGFSIDTPLVGAFTVLKWRGNVDKEKGAHLGDRLARSLAGVLVGSNGRGDDCRTGLGELSRDKGDSLNVGVAVLSAEAQLGRELVAHSVSQKEGN